MWHYAQNGASQGPLPPADLEALLQKGAIDGDTLIWREGFPDWLPLHAVEAFQVVPASVEVAAEATPPPGLRLRTTPSRIRRINSGGGGAEAEPPLSVRDLIAGNEAAAGGVRAAHAAESKSSSGGSWFRVAPFELQFFVVTFALAVIAAAVVAVVRDPVEAVLPFLLQSFLGILVGGVIFRIRTFQAGVGWGIAGLIIGLTDLLFVFNHWEMAKPSVFLTLGSCLVLAGVLLGPWSGLWMT